MSPSLLPIAVRAHTVRTKPKKGSRRRKPEPLPETWPAYVLILDTETTTDRTQRLLFAGYRVGQWTTDGKLLFLEEGFVYGDDLPDTDPDGFSRLERYAHSHRADIAPGHEPILRLYSRAEFMSKVFFPMVSYAGAIVVGFNLPFDLSRLAVRASASRQAKTFSFIVFDHKGGDSMWGPRLRIKARDRRSAFIRLGRPRRGPRRAKPGRFLDLKTLAHALTDKDMTLAAACEAFGVAHGKLSVEVHGVISDEYVAYNRRDVLATAELLERLRAEFGRHPISLLPDRAYSPASIAKAYLHAMGVWPLTDDRSTLTPYQLGGAMSAYLGGRAEGHIRNWSEPVVYLDFLSMYPTVNALLGLWAWHTARRVRAVDATAEVRRLLGRVTLREAFTPSLWGRLNFFAQIAPDGDVVPVRAPYGSGGAYNIGLNPLSGDQPLWYAGPDLIASVLLGGKPPKVIKAFKIAPEGRAPGLKRVKLRGMVEVNPAAGDFFRTVVELRKRAANDPAIPASERERLTGVLKTMANAGSYGIYGEVNRQDGSREPVPIMVYGGSRPFRTETKAFEEPGRFCFPPVAALITAGARLMLAILERCVTDLGGTYAFCDTDSMAIVAAEAGVLLACPGGTHRLADGSEAIRALSWAEVDGIVQRFARLSPYDRCAVPGSILKVEDVNFDPETGERRELWAYVISAKRYALYTMEGGRVHILANKEHGLGHLLNPRDPDAREERGQRKWVTEPWAYLIAKALGRHPQPPAWLDRPALSRVTVSDPSLLRAFTRLNHGKPYPDQVKPFNFALAAHVRPFGHPTGADPERFQLVAPYESDPRRWQQLPWVNRYDGEPCGISTVGDHGSLGIARVATYADVLETYKVHPEAKSLGPDGEPCGPVTAGLLGQRPVRVIGVVYIGKESNKLEEVEAGLEHEWDEVLNVYTDPKSWQRVLTALKRAPRSFIAQHSGISERRVTAIRQGYEEPRPKTRRALTYAATEWARSGSGHS